MITISELSNSNFAFQNLIDEKLFQIDLEIPNLIDLQYETMNDANTFHRFLHKENTVGTKINLIPLNDKAKESSETYDHFDEIRVYNSLLKDERDEGYYYIDLLKSGEENWSFRLRSKEIISLLKTPETL